MDKILSNHFADSQVNHHAIKSLMDGLLIRNDSIIQSNNVVVDADCVIFDFLESWEIACQIELGRKVTKIDASYDLSLRYGLTHDEKNLVWKHYNDNEMCGKLSLLSGADKAILALSLAGYNVHIVSAIDEKARTLREGNLNKFGIENYTLHCTGPNKKETLRLLNPIIFFDDNVAHHVEAKEVGIKHRVWIEDNDIEDFEHVTAKFSSLAIATEWFLKDKSIQHPQVVSKI